MRHSGALGRLTQLVAIGAVAVLPLAWPSPPAVGDSAVRRSTTTTVPTTELPTTTVAEVPTTTTTVPPFTVSTQPSTQPPPVQGYADPAGIGPQLEALGATPDVVAVFLCIVQRESRFDPQAVNPSSGAGGLFQFLPSTWQAIGRAGLPNEASASDQIAAAWDLFQSQGFAPWGGGCS